MYVNFFALIIGLIIGFCLLRMFAINRPIFYKWPSPDNMGKVTYKDKNGVCYQYSGENINCATYKGQAKPLPLQVPQPYAVLQ